MPEETQPLDIAKFKLEAYKTAVELQISVMKAYADYNFRMMEVLEKRVQIETAVFKLRVMQDAYHDYRIARTRSMRLVRSLEEKVERHTTAIQRISYLAFGEAATASQAGLGWRGFWYLVSQAPVDTVLAMGKPRCRAADRKAKNYYRPTASGDEAPMENALSSIKNSLVLMDWARKRRCVPRLGSPPVEKLAELLQILGKGAKLLSTDLKQDLTAAEKQLRKIRAANWRTLKIELESPQEP